jgi:choline dehydrogenase
MGKVLGGDSSINRFDVVSRADWDLYTAEVGDPSWSYAAVLDLYRHRVE